MVDVLSLVRFGFHEVLIMSNVDTTGNDGVMVFNPADGSGANGFMRTDVDGRVVPAGTVFVPNDVQAQGLLLQGNDKMRAEGSWVFRTVDPNTGIVSGQGTHADFRNVSAHWYPQTLSFEEGLEVVSNQKAAREDIMFDARHVVFEDDGQGKFCVRIGERSFYPTDWAARQLCNWFKVPQTLWVAYMGGETAISLPVLLLAFITGRGMYETEKKLLFRTYNDGTLRGVMSDSYSIVDNDQFLEILQAFIPGGRLSHFTFSDADNFYGNIIIPDTIRSESDSDYGGMLACGNSAIGRRSASILASIFRAICMNGCVWGEKKGIELRRRHRGIDMVEFREAMRVNIETQIPLTTTKIPELLSTRQMKMTATVPQLFAMICKANGFTKEQLNTVAETWLKETDHDKSAFSVYDAFTRAGQKFDADTYETCNIIGGSILNGGTDGWYKMNMKAQLLTEAEVVKAFGNE
jgi:Domain of unknown function (DUF932)